MTPPVIKVCTGYIMGGEQLAFPQASSRTEDASRHAVDDINPALPIIIYRNSHSLGSLRSCRIYIINSTDLELCELSAVGE